MINLGNRKWRFLFLLAIVWLLFTASYAVFFVQKTDTTTRSYETMKFAFLSISAFGVLFSALLSSFNSLEATQNLIDRTEFDRIENSFYYIRTWESSILREARDKAREVDKQVSNLSAAQLLGNIDADPALERSVITMFNFFEEIHLSRKAGRVNDAYLRQSFKDIYIRVCKIFTPWMESDVDATMRSNLDELRQDWERKQS